MQYLMREVDATIGEGRQVAVNWPIEAGTHKIRIVYRLETYWIGVSVRYRLRQMKHEMVSRNGLDLTFFLQL